MSDAFDKYMEAARRRRARRPAATKIAYRKSKIVIIKRGRVVHSVKTHDELNAFLRGYDPEFAARRERAASGEAERKIAELLGDDA